MIAEVGASSNGSRPETRRASGSKKDVVPRDPVDAIQQNKRKSMRTGTAKKKPDGGSMTTRFVLALSIYVCFGRKHCIRSSMSIQSFLSFSERQKAPGVPTGDNMKR